MSVRRLIHLLFWLMIALAIILASGAFHLVALDVVQIGDPPRPDLIIQARRLYPLLLVLCCVGFLLALSVAAFGVDYERGVGIALAIIMFTGVVAFAVRSRATSGSILRSKQSHLVVGLLLTP